MVHCHMVKLANNGAGQGTGAQINMGAFTADEQYSHPLLDFMIIQELHL